MCIRDRCGDDSFCAVKADKGFRATTRQLFQSRLAHVSDRFLRADDKEGRCFDFDDFLTELQGWLSILRAKNIEEDVNANEDLSFVLTPAATLANSSVESVAPSPVAGEFESSF